MRTHETKEKSVLAVLCPRSAYHSVVHLCASSAWENSESLKTQNLAIIAVNPHFGFEAFN